MLQDPTNLAAPVPQQRVFSLTAMKDTQAGVGVHTFYLADHGYWGEPIEICHRARRVEASLHRESISSNAVDLIPVASRP